MFILIKRKSSLFTNSFVTVLFLQQIIVQALISVEALVFDLAQLSCQKRFDCKNTILWSSTILLGTSYSQIVVAVILLGMKILCMVYCFSDIKYCMEHALLPLILRRFKIKNQYNRPYK